MASAADWVLDDIWDYQDANNLKNHWPGTSAPTSPTAWTTFWNTSTKVLSVYDGAAWLPLGEAGGVAPVGTITGWVGGYFTNGTNGGYTRVLGSANTVAGANAYLNPLGWYVCDGAALNDGDSPIWDAAGRYLPNLDDDRFLMGDTTAGTQGGSNLMAHTHDVDVASKTSGGPSATVSVTAGGTTVAHPTHTHSFDPDSVTSDAASNTENRPAYLSVFLICRVK